MKVVGKSGDDWLLVEDDWEPGQIEAVGWVVRGRTAYEYYVESILAQGYWEVATGNATEITTPVLNWVKLIPHPERTTL